MKSIQTKGIRNLLNKNNYSVRILWGKTQISSVGSNCQHKASMKEKQA
jgi:hypothetical protein